MDVERDWKIEMTYLILTTFQPREMASLQIADPVNQKSMSNISRLIDDPHSEK